MGRKKVSRPNHVNLLLTEDQFKLGRRKLFVEGLNWNTLLRAAVNAYIMGDFSVTKDGRYAFQPPSDHLPAIYLQDGEDEVELEVDWSVKAGKPQVGRSEKPFSVKNSTWGTEELLKYLRSETGRRIAKQTLYTVLKMLEIPKRNGRRYGFKGPDDPLILKILDAFDNGIYEIATQETLDRSLHWKWEQERKTKEYQQTSTKAEEAKRIQHLKKLRKIEDS